jgi:hypothetical protein
MFFMNIRPVPLGLAVLLGLALVARVQAQIDEDPTLEPTRDAATTVNVTPVPQEPQAATSPSQTNAGERALGEKPANNKTGSWYGWQTLSADALSIGLITLAGLLDSQATALVGLASLNLASPLIHFVHGRSGAGWLSGGVRVASTALTFGGAALAMEDAFDFEGSHDSAKETVGVAMFVTGMLGMAAMIAVDASLAIDEHAPSDGSTAHLQLIPLITHGSQGAAIQLSLQM